MVRRALETHEQIQHDKIEMRERGVCATMFLAGYLQKMQDLIINRSTKLK